MATTDLTSDTFANAVDGDGIVLVDFWAEWCGPCKQFAPVYEQAAQAHPDITFAKVDTEAEQALAAMASITSIPTLMAFRDGILVFAQPGAGGSGAGAGHRRGQRSRHGRRAPQGRAGERGRHRRAIVKH